MKTDKIKRVISGLKEEESVEITTKNGSFEGIIKRLSDVLLVLALFEPMTSPKAHSYHWAAGDLKSVMFRNILKIKVLNTNPMT